ncbi:MAG TPA: MFS transporter [Candidatus Limnocylindria bacterium]
MASRTALPRSVYLFALVSLFGDVSTEMLYPILPLFLTRELGAPRTAVGIIEGVADATQNIVQGASGWLADRIGRSKPIAIVGYVLAALAKPTIGLASAWPMVLASRFVDRLGTGIRSAPRDALIASTVDESRRGAAFGLEGIGDNMGAVLGPLLAALLLYVLHVQTRAIFLIAFVPGLVAVALITSVPETRAARVNEERFDVRALPTAYWRYLAAIVVFGIGNASSAFLILRASDVGVPAELTLIVYAGYNLVAALASYPAGRLSDTWGRKPVMVATLAVFAATFALLAVASTGALVAVAFGLYGLYRGALRTAGKALAVDLAPAELRATGVGMYSSAIGLSALVAGAIAGGLWDRIGAAATFGWGAGCGAVGAILLALLVRR